MTRLAAKFQISALTRHEGLALLSAQQALLKGVLEAEMEIALLTGAARGPFASVFDAAAERVGSSEIPQLLRQHNLRVAATPDGSRAITLASFQAKAGRAGVVLLRNIELDQVVPTIGRAFSEPLEKGAVCIVMEDAPSNVGVSCPRRVAQRLNMLCVEPGDVAQLRDAIEHGLRLSRAGKCPAAIVVHESILRSSDTLELRPNRVLGSVDALLARRRRTRTLRGSEAAGPLRVARRLELNRFRAIPSPGERVGVGFITVGPADGAIQHITNALGLHGRVPVLQLGLINPIDESAVQRLLTRCQQVIVLEPRPGAMELSIMAAAEMMRHAGETPATVWGRRIPPDSNGQSPSMTSDADLHPSILVRKITHLLHAIRPTIQVASQLMPELPIQVRVPAREAQMGQAAAIAMLKRMLTDVDQWLRDKAPLEERGIDPTALAIDGASPAGGLPRIVNVETWEHARFQREGIPALIQAARSDRPWIFVVCETTSEEIRDLERFARGAVPADSADRVKLESVNLNDRIAVRDELREASMSDRMTVIIARDGPPPQFDASAIEQSLKEVDRLGFEPVQTLVRPADEVCVIRPPIDDGEERSRVQHAPDALKPEFSVEKLTKQSGAAVRLHVRPLLEEVQVIRTRPPLRSWRAESAVKLPVPHPLHASQPQWRAHVAGFRGEPPGLAALVLCEAGRLMGYHVRSIHDPMPIATGWRAWSQVLFTRPRDGDGSASLAAVTPYGEADLLLGLDDQETLRAVVADPSLRVASSTTTNAIVNTGDIGDDQDAGSRRINPADLVAAVQSVSRDDVRLIDNFSAACRLWFHTERVADVAMLGTAFQLGLIPVSLDAMEGAIAAMESRGYGRARETLEFGRMLAIAPKLFLRPTQEQEENITRLTRRTVLTLSRGEWGGGSRARNFSHLLQRSLSAMPGLAETDAGRIARRDFIVACHRCRIWGGLEYAQHFADLIVRLYHADRGDTGRALTRNAVLPLAEVMLIRDPLYIASMASSSEQRRRMRLHMNVKMARGDRIERRYLTRLELIAFNRRFRADVRTSDWPARAVAMMRRVVPYRFRGSRRERELRDYIIDFIRRVIDGAPPDYDRHLESLHRLHNQAAEDRLRGMALAEISMLIQSSAAGPTAGQTPTLLDANA